MQKHINIINTILKFSSGYFSASSICFYVSMYCLRTPVLVASLSLLYIASALRTFSAIMTLAINWAPQMIDESSALSSKISIASLFALALFRRSLCMYVSLIIASPLIKPLCSSRLMTGWKFSSFASSHTSCCPTFKLSNSLLPSLIVSNQSSSSPAVIVYFMRSSLSLKSFLWSTVNTSLVRVSNTL